MMKLTVFVHYKFLTLLLLFYWVINGSVLFLRNAYSLTFVLRANLFQIVSTDSEEICKFKMHNASNFRQSWWRI